MQLVVWFRARLYSIQSVGNFNFIDGSVPPVLGIDSLRLADQLKKSKRGSLTLESP